MVSEGVGVLNQYPNKNQRWESPSLEVSNSLNLWLMINWNKVGNIFEGILWTVIIVASFTAIVVMIVSTW